MPQKRHLRVYQVIYSVADINNAQPLKGILDVYVTQDEVKVDDCEYVVDAYAEILKAEKEGKIVIERFEDITDKKREWIVKTISSEYENTDNEDYKEFLLDKFEWLKENGPCKQKQ